MDQRDPKGFWPNLSRRLVAKAISNVVYDLGDANSREQQANPSRREELLGRFYMNHAAIRSTTPPIQRTETTLIGLNGYTQGVSPSALRPKHTRVFNSYKIQSEITIDSPFGFIVVADLNLTWK
jgi:hypothetical protein